MLVLCTLIAGFGEIILSLVWGLYDYQFSNLPLFVPPGHALLMTLGLITSRILLKHKAGRAFQAIFPWCAFIYAGLPGECILTNLAQCFLAFLVFA